MGKRILEEITVYLSDGELVTLVDKYAKTIEIPTDSDEIRSHVVWWFWDLIDEVVDEASSMSYDESIECFNSMYELVVYVDKLAPSEYTATLVYCCAENGCNFTVVSQDEFRRR